MNYTDSDASVVHGGTGHRLHQDTSPVTTVVSARDLNMVIWSLMKLLEDAGITAATFDPDSASTYSRVSQAVQALAGAGQVIGSFTPTLSFGGSSAGITYALQSGSYVKTGRYVEWACSIVLTSKGSAAGDAVVTLGTLPVSSGSRVTKGGCDVMTGLPGPINGFILGGTNDVEVHVFNGSSSSAVSCTDANFTNTTTLYFSGEHLEP